MIISVASGKGGTGKTTVATNLARSIGSNVQLLDCDVEEPNAHLFINPLFKASETVSTPVPEVNEDKCTYCGKCAEICQFKAIAVVNENVLVFEELCHSCSGCWEICPEGAIQESGRELGIIFMTDGGDLRALAATCTHLDCTVQHRPDLGIIWCSCHNGRYDTNGQNISGPPPKPLATYTINEVDGTIFVSREEA